MTRLDNYRSALLVAFPEISNANLDRALVAGGHEFVSFVIDYGLGPLWHVRTGRAEFKASRLAAEALYMAQEKALSGIAAALDDATIEYAVIKGAASRLLLYKNPAVRACHDLDLLVQAKDRVRAATALVNSGFTASPIARGISRELVLSRNAVDIDLHWGLLREGRLRVDFTAAMLGRRRRSGAVWILNAEDSLFVLLVHSAFAKHLAGWDMGLHRVVDVLWYLRTQSFDWQAVRLLLEQNGVQTAAWATLRWLEILSCPHTGEEMGAMSTAVRPGRLRCTWLDFWLRNDFSARTSDEHWARLLGFSSFLHDTPGDFARAIAGLHRARRRRRADIEVFLHLAD